MQIAYSIFIRSSILPTTPLKNSTPHFGTTDTVSKTKTHFNYALVIAVLVLGGVLAWFFWYIPRQSHDPGQLLEASYQNLMPDSILSGPQKSMPPIGKSIDNQAKTKPSKQGKPSTAIQKPTGSQTLADPPTPKLPQSKSQTHLVLAGQTLFQICRKYGVSEAQIRQANNLSGSAVQAGQQLQIPVTGLHIVQSGEALFSIAKKYNTTIEAIKQINNMKNNDLKQGQQLIIPLPS